MLLLSMVKVSGFRSLKRDKKNEELHVFLNKKLVYKETSVKDHSCYKSKNRLPLRHMLIGRRRGDRILSPIEFFAVFTALCP